MPIDDDDFVGSAQEEAERAEREKDARDAENLARDMREREEEEEEHEGEPPNFDDKDEEEEGRMKITPISASGVTGSHVSLRSSCRKACRFDSCLAH